MKLDNKTYDILKWIAQILIPATATLVGAIGGHLEWAPTDTVVFCMVAFDTFLGTILGISSYNYSKGEDKHE